MSREINSQTFGNALAHTRVAFITMHTAQVGLTDKGHAIKRLVVCWLMPILRGVGFKVHEEG